jgi:23S rRNA pseudouridine955/2504/2580 synthase
MREIIIGENEKEQRIDRFLLKFFNNSSRANVYKLLRKKTIKVNGVRIKEDYFLKDGDIVQVFLSDESFDKLIEEEKILEPEDVDIDIVYEDDEILVVNKPKGMLTHPDKDEYKETMSTKVYIYLRHLSTRTFKPASIQRLDKNTSGLIIFCKTYDSLKKYNVLMRERKIEKYYLTVVKGDIDNSGEIKGFLHKDEVNNKVTFSKEKSSEKDKFCHTKYKLLKRIKGFSLVEIELLTGRTHQIRASLESIGFSIVGDKKYGGTGYRGEKNQLLHCYKIKVENKTFEAPSPEIDGFLNSI